MDWSSLLQAAPAVLGAVGGLGAQASANSAAEGQAKHAAQAAQAAQAAWGQVKPPTLEELLMHQYGVAGTLDPALEQAQQLSTQDQLQNVAVDPRLRNAQMSALNTMQTIGQTGYTPEQRAQLNSMRQQTEADNTSRLKQLMQQQDARGVGSSDMSLAMRAMEAQGAANRQAADVSNTASTGFKQALDAMGQSGQLAGNMSAAEYQQKAALAEALRNREISNMQQQANVGQRNVGAQNTAQQFNITNRQDVGNKNTDVQNQQDMYNKNTRLQQNFANQATVAGGKTGANQAAANTYGAMASNTAAAGANAAKGMGEAGLGLSKFMGSFGSPTASTTAAATSPNARSAAEWDKFTKGS